VHNEQEGNDSGERVRSWRQWVDGRCRRCFSVLDSAPLPPSPLWWIRIVDQCDLVNCQRLECISVGNATFADETSIAQQSHAPACTACTEWRPPSRSSCMGQTCARCRRQLHRCQHQHRPSPLASWTQPDIAALLLGIYVKSAGVWCGEILIIVRPQGIKLAKTRPFCHVWRIRQRIWRVRVWGFLRR
jgi:hypothetical protein